MKVFHLEEGRVMDLDTKTARRFLAINHARVPTPEDLEAEAKAAKVKADAKAAATKKASKSKSKK